MASVFSLMSLMGADFSKVLLKDAKHISKALSHAWFMESDCRTALAKNVRALMDHHGYTQTKLADKSGVSQRNISSVLNANCESSPTLETIQKIASAFHVTSWHLLLPGLQIDLLINSRLEKVVENFTHATHEGRDMISRVSDREAAIAYTVDPIKKKA